MGVSGIFDFVGDAAGDFLPGGGFLGAEHFGEVVEDEDVAGIGAARAEGTDRDGEMEDAAVDDDFDFAGDDAHAQRAAHQVLDGAGSVRAEEVVERLLFARGGAEHADDGGVGAQDGAIGVEGNDAGGNVFEDGFHELAAALEFLDGLLEVAGELVDLRAVVAELRGHGVEGAHQDAEFVLHLIGNLIVKIAGGNFAGAFGEGLNGNGDLFGEKQGHPHDGEEEKDGEKGEDEQHLAFQRAEVLFFGVILGGLRLDGVEAFKEIGTGAIGGDQKCGRLAWLVNGMRAAE